MNSEASDTLARLAHRMRRCELAPRAVVVREGSRDDSTFLIPAGRVAVRRNGPESGLELKGLLIEPAVVTEDRFQGESGAPASPAGAPMTVTRGIRAMVTSVVSVDI